MEWEKLQLVASIYPNLGRDMGLLALTSLPPLAGESEVATTEVTGLVIHVI